MINEKIFEESSLRIGYVICVVTAIGFICSLTYNCGYFWLFDAGIRVLSIGDILTSYTLWVPGLSALIFGYSLDLFLQHLEKNDRLIKSIKRKKTVKKFLWLPHMIIFTSMVVLLVSYILFGFLYRPIVIWFSCCYIWLSFTAHISTLSIFNARNNKFILWVFVFIPIILSLMFAIGVDKALHDAKINTPNVMLYFFDESADAQPAIEVQELII